MLGLLVALLLVWLTFLWWCWCAHRRSRRDSLDWESGRRKARQLHKKSSDFYNFYGVTSTEEYFVTSRGVELFTKEWLPADGRLRGVVFYCHGYGDTCTYAFEDVAIRLAASGYAVESLDFEGHGVSAGLHGFIPRFEQLADDVIEWSNALRARPALSHLPFFLYGESMGGAVSLLTHMKQPTAWNGAVLVAPMCKISPEMMPPPLVVAALSFLARFFPRLQLVPTREISEVGFRDPAKRARLEANPVGYGGRPRLLTALQMLQTTQFIGQNLDKVSLPFLVLHGAADVVTDPAVSESLYKQARSVDKSFRLYEGCWHGLTSAEPDEMVERIISDMVSWLHARSLPPSAVFERKAAAAALAAVARMGSAEDEAAGMGSPVMASTASWPLEVSPVAGKVVGGMAMAASESPVQGPASEMGAGAWGMMGSAKVPWQSYPSPLEDDSSSNSVTF